MRARSAATIRAPPGIASAGQVTSTIASPCAPRAGGAQCGSRSATSSRSASSPRASIAGRYRRSSCSCGTARVRSASTSRRPTMANDLKLYVRTADQTRRAELTLERSRTGAELIQAAVDNWRLPGDTDYALVNTTTGRALAPDATLDESEVKEGDLLEVQPVLVAGR